MITDINVSKYVDILRQFTTQEFKEGQLNETMADLGINSFNAIEIMIAIEVEFNVEFPDSLISPELFISPRTLYEGLMTVIDGMMKHERKKQ